MLDSLVQAARDSKRSVLSLLVEAIRLRYSGGQIGISEYIDFQLYLDDLTFAEKTTFGGWRAQVVLEEILEDENSLFLSIDKVTMYSLLRAYGFPIPKLTAVYRSQRPPTIQNITSPEALALYLRVEQHLPVYLKPANGSFGRGNTLIRRLDQDMLMLGNGSSIDLDQFCQSLDDGRPLGWILQEPLVPHSRIVEVCGDKISGVRIHTFFSPDGSEILKAIFKINGGREDTDNFRHGASGNMLAALDINTGIITRVVSGTGLGQRINPSHPKSGRELLGFQLPHWAEIKSLVCEAQLAFPGFICPGWDIAICDDGPKVLEINYFGDIDLSQFAYRQGFLDERFMRLMKSRGLDQLLSCNPQRSKKSKKNHRIGLRKHHWNW